MLSFLLMAAAVACSRSGGNEGPGAAMMSFHDALRKGDVERAAKFFPTSDDSTEAVRLRARAMTAIPNFVREERARPSETRVLKEEVTGDVAQVTVVEQPAGGGRSDTVTVGLIRKNGRWTFDPTSP